EQEAAEGVGADRSDAGETRAVVDEQAVGGDAGGGEGFGGDAGAGGEHVGGVGLVHGECGEQLLGDDVAGPLVHLAHGFGRGWRGVLEQGGGDVGRDVVTHAPAERAAGGAPHPAGECGGEVVGAEGGDGPFACAAVGGHGAGERQHGAV